MSSRKAVRNRKSEMVSCWVCAIFVAVVFCVKSLLIGMVTMNTFNIVLIVLFVIWVLIAAFYTFQYMRWKKKNDVRDRQ